VGAQRRAANLARLPAPGAPSHAKRRQAGIAQQLKALRSGTVFVDGFKGPRLSFRPWDGQLRQPLFISHVDGVVGMAPLDGVLHPTELLDTLGVDEKESKCH